MRILCQLLLCLLAAPVAQADQRAFLRKRRSLDSRPVITLPESLLDEGSNTDGRQKSADSKLAEKIQSGTFREGYGTELWNAVHESAEEMVDDAREAFFAAREASDATTLLTTTVAPGTTRDLTVLAKQLGLSINATLARNMLVDMVNNSQIQMLQELTAVSKDLEGVDAHAKADMQVLNLNYPAAKNLPIITYNTEEAVNRIILQESVLDAEVKGVVRTSVDNKKRANELLFLKKHIVDASMTVSKKLPSGQRRIRSNLQLLNVLVPRLKRLEKRLTKIESRLYGGNLTQMTGDVASREFMNVVEDVPRGFGRYLPNAR